MSERIYLLDASILIPLTMEGHSLSERALNWFTRQEWRFATCPITQGALIRHHCRLGGGSIVIATQVLRGLTDRRGHIFWPDNLSYLALPERGLRGHKQVTDFYLAALAAKNGGRLATLTNRWPPCFLTSVS